MLYIFQFVGWRNNSF